MKTIAFNLAQNLPNNPLLLITPNQTWAEYLYNNLIYWTKSSENIYWFCDWETLPYDQHSPHNDLISKRLRVLAEIPLNNRAIIVCSAQNLLQKLCPQSYLDGFGLHLKTNINLPREKLIERLVIAGYQKSSIIYQQGEYSTRGEILDFFPMGAKNPIRIQWLDDQIEQLRTFSIDNQKTIAKIDQISILPAKEYDLSNHGRTCFRQNFRQIFGKNSEKSAIYQSVSQNQPTQGLEYYLPLFFDQTDSLLNYLPDNCQVLLLENAQEKLFEQYKYCQKRYERLNILREGFLLKPELIWFEPNDLLNQLNSLPKLQINQQNIKLIEFDGDAHHRLKKWLDIIKNNQTTLHFASNGIKEHWQNQITELAINNDDLQLVVSPNRFNFQINNHIHLSESQLHPQPLPINITKQSNNKLQLAIQSLQDLTINAPVVHIHYGIGRYGGLTIMDEEEMLLINYANDGKLFVAIDDLDLISRYNGSFENAPLHALGSKQWQTVKSKIKQSLYDTAAELLHIYAQREKQKGQKINLDNQALNQISDSFPYQETVDQIAAIDEVLKDLASDKPMDRIICGDVGFGKTEIAVRAAFATILAGKQVALIAPTTLLAEQHYHHFADRFSDTAINLASISRFKTTKQQKDILETAKNKQIDMVIGTHRLLQKDVEFPNLGLVIIDEEQRFGVKDKEKLKKLRLDVNLLTLTATPIPRTLNLALSGLRDLSIVNTPPVGRQSVKTQCSEWDLALIEDACERELQRGGQIYFIHNNVSTIENIAQTIQKILPNNKIAIAHGQMPEKILEQIMQDFANKHYDILITTTIIESGIDIPNANTIIINRADKLGLAQLHQLRGRVGRSHNQAYAYLITPNFNQLTKDAQKRLTTFSQIDSLGAGFLLASQDLDIRGAGEILGNEQSGQIAQIGMTYYLELLEKAITDLQNNQTNLIDTNQKHEITINKPALLPESYLPDPQLRLFFYQKLAKAANEKEIDDLHIELIDRFGSLPFFAQNLFAKARLKLRAKSINITKIQLKTPQSLIDFHPDAKINPTKLMQEIQQNPHIYQMISPTSIKVLTSSDNQLDQFVQINQLLDKISND